MRGSRGQRVQRGWVVVARRRRRRRRRRTSDRARRGTLAVRGKGIDDVCHSILNDTLDPIVFEFINISFLQTRP